ncbi:MAG: hypothetical protein QXV81_09440 [Ignisphaera sp.]
MPNPQTILFKPLIELKRLYRERGEVSSAIIGLLLPVHSRVSQLLRLYRKTFKPRDGVTLNICGVI